MNIIGGSNHVREELTAALADGRGVTAKVCWISKHGEEGRNKWVHCTPLLGINGQIGVWMIVVVDDERHRIVRERERGVRIGGGGAGRMALSVANDHRERDRTTPDRYDKYGTSAAKGRSSMERDQAMPQMHRSAPPSKRRKKSASSSARANAAAHPYGYSWEPWDCAYG